MVPSASVDVDLKFTVAPAIGLAGEGVPMAAFGGALMRTASVAVLVRPRSSVTCSATVNVPAMVNVFLADFAVASPKVPLLSRSHDCAVIVPSASEDVDELNVAACPTVGTAGVTLMRATGGWLATTLTVLVMLALSARLGGCVPVTVSLTDFAPGEVWVCDGPPPLPLAPSPKSQLWLSIEPPVA